MKVWIGVVAVFGSMAGCGVENQDRIDTIVGLTGDPVAGEPVFQTHCAACHAATAVGGSGPNLVGNTDTEFMAGQILNGGETMLPFADTLDDQAVADIMAWTMSL